MRRKILIILMGVSLTLVSKGQSIFRPDANGRSLITPMMPQSFSGNFWICYNHTSESNQQICAPCHVPHGNLNDSINPIWNNQSSVKNYTLYQSANNPSMETGTPNGTSKLCLSCHDGIVAIGRWSANAPSDTDRANLKTDITNEHPVSVNYAHALAAGYGNLRPLTDLVCGPNTVPYCSANITVSDLLDENGNIQCTSCHGAHENSTGYQLRLINKGSQLCFACHRR